MAKAIIHKELADALRDLLEGGTYSPHDPFLSLREIGKQYDVTPSTAQAAVTRLAQQGFLYIEHGKGSFVAPRISTRNILLVIDIGHTSGAMPIFLAGLRQAFEEAPEYVQVQESSERFLERLPELKFHYPKLDGVIIFRRIDTYLQSTQTLQSLEMPCVFYGSDMHMPFLGRQSYRTISESTIVNMALDYLASKGHTRIGFVSRSYRSDQNGRHGLFLKWMVEHGHTVDKRNVLAVSRTVDTELALSYSVEGFSAETDATALFCVDDLVAQRAMNYLVKMGVRIPHDISVIGVNNYPFCEETITPLTSINIPWFEDGEAVGHQLLSLIKDPKQLIQTQSNVSLAERFSTQR